MVMVAVEDQHAAARSWRHIERREFDGRWPIHLLRRAAGVQIKYQQSCRLQHADDKVMVFGHRQTSQAQRGGRGACGERPEIAEAWRLFATQAIAQRPEVRSRL